MKLSNLFGPLALIIGKQIVDAMKFIALLIIFMLGFTMLTMAMNEPYKINETNSNIDEMSRMEIKEELRKGNVGLSCATF